MENKDIKKPGVYKAEKYAKEILDKKYIQTMKEAIDKAIEQMNKVTVTKPSSNTISYYTTSLQGTHLFSGMPFYTNSDHTNWYWDQSTWDSGNTYVGKFNYFDVMTPTVTTPKKSTPRAGCKKAAQNAS